MNSRVIGDNIAILCHFDIVHIIAISGSTLHTFEVVNFRLRVHTPLPKQERPH